MVSRMPVAPQSVALAMNSGVGGRMDVICSVMDEAEDDECRRE